MNLLDFEVINEDEISGKVNMTVPPVIGKDQLNESGWKVLC